MRNSIIVLFLILGVRTFSQESFQSDNRNSAKFSYGLFYPLKSQFRNPLADLRSSLPEPVPSLGIGLEHPRGYGRRNVCFEYGITYFMNQRTVSPDSVKTNWFAFNVYYLYKYDVFPRNKYIDLFVGLGPQVGGQFLTLRKSGAEIYRNFNLSLIPHLELRLQPLKRISLGASADFLFDLTGSKWKTFDARTYPVNYTKFTGMSLKFFAGWCWGK